MARRSILSAQERQSLIALPDNQTDFIRHYSLSESDISLIGQKRGNTNRLGFAIQLCYMRYPGIALSEGETPDRELLKFVATQLDCHPNDWETYGLREVTKREHSLELQRLLGFSAFSRQNYQKYVQYIANIAIDTDKGMILAENLVRYLRANKILLPTVLVIDKLCAEAITKANKIIYERLTFGLTQPHFDKLDALLQHKSDTKFTHLGWLRQTPLKPIYPNSYPYRPLKILPRH